MVKAANIGPVDRLIRLVVGLTLVLLPISTTFAFWQDPAARWGFIAVGAVLTATAIVRFCPAYRLLGIRTCKTG